MSKCIDDVQIFLLFECNISMISFADTKALAEHIMTTTRIILEGSLQTPEQEIDLVKRKGWLHYSISRLKIVFRKTSRPPEDMTIEEQAEYHVSTLAHLRPQFI